MEKKTIGEINNELAQCIADEIKTGNYTFEVRNRTFNHGYIDITLNIGGEKADVSVNRKGYICWQGLISDEVSKILKRYDVEDRIAEDVFNEVMKKYFVDEED